MESVVEKLERQKESLIERSIQIEKEFQTRLLHEKNSFEEEIERLTREKVNVFLQFLNLKLTTIC